MAKKTAILWRTLINLLIVSGVLFAMLSICVGAPMLLGEWFWAAYLIGMGSLITFCCYSVAREQVEEKKEKKEKEEAN